MISSALNITKSKNTSTKGNHNFLVQRKCKCGAESKLSGQCDECEKDKFLGVQTKLRVGAANDACEQEADYVADQIMRRPTNRDCGERTEKHQGKYLKLIVQRKVSNQLSSQSSVPSSVDKVLGSTGKPLEGSTREFMESRFEHEFSQVKIHTGNDADQSAREINARAYTVGQNVVLANGEYAPSSNTGRLLLAHELTHTIQQGSLNPSTSNVIQRVGFFQKIARFFGGGKFGETELQDYLDLLRSSKDIEGNYDSDNKARAIVQAWQQGGSGFILTSLLKSLLIKEMNTGYVADDDERSILSVLQRSDNSELSFIFGAGGVTAKGLNKRFDGKQLKQLQSFYNSRFEGGSVAVLAGTVKPKGNALAPGFDALGGTRELTEAEHAKVEGIFRPGSTVTITPAAPPPGGGAPPPPTVTITNPPLMTGAGVGGAFEIAMLASLKANVGSWASSFRALKAQAGQPAFPIGGANTIAKSAQRVSESHFAPYISVASRSPADTYHPNGSYQLESQLGDQSTRPITDAGSAGHPGRIGWSIYWSTLSKCRATPCGQTVLNNHHALAAGRDSVEVRRVIDLFATDAANRTDIDDAIHGWPAEATGGVFIQPYVAASTPAQLRFARWDLFTTLIHEMMHILTHPNFEKTATAVGGTPQKYLMEGFADVMRHDLWDGSDGLKNKLATEEAAPLRERVEGGQYPYHASSIYYHPDYPEYKEAKDIVNIVGINNAKAAFFLGHTELLGIGQGTQSSVPLAGIGQFSNTDAAEKDILVSGPGDTTYRRLQERTNAAPGGILDDRDGRVLSEISIIKSGRRYRIAGIRWVTAIKNDTLASVAKQNNVTVSALAVANNLPANSLDSHTFVVGQRILIPIH